MPALCVSTGLASLNDSFWDFYWESHLAFLQGQGKGFAIQSASQILRGSTKPARILELGCGEGQILGSLLQAHPEKIQVSSSMGVDRDDDALGKARRDYPGLQFLSGSFTDARYLSTLGKIDLILLVNALHHAFSDAYDEELGQIDEQAGKQNVAQTFAAICTYLNPGGYLLLFDGVEANTDAQQWIEFRFRHPAGRQRFEQFTREYLPFRIQSQPGSTADSVCLRQRDFTRYITKLIFVGKPLWERERRESYQYFNESEFCAMFDQNELSIVHNEIISVDYERWQDEIELITAGIEFPPEHILLVGQRC